jgi:hypothetical protein
VKIKGDAGRDIIVFKVSLVFTRTNSSFDEVVKEVSG